MIRWIINQWHAWQRAADLAILWPSCKRQSPSLDMAKATFAAHAFADPAWLCLGRDTIVAIIDSLE